MFRAILYAVRDPEIHCRPDRHWEKMFIRPTEHQGDPSAPYPRSR